MSPVKEPHFFGSDLVNRYGIQNPERYAGLFAGADDAKWVGEASVWYLMSKRAAAEIRGFNPAARVVIMLREPVEMLHSLHAQRVFSGNEDVVDFRVALAAERDRVRGGRIPRGCQPVQGLFYRQVVDYVPQVRRYLDVFGRDRVHIILYDDFAFNPEAMYGELMEFLELKGSRRTEFAVYNASKLPRSLVANRLIRKPPPILRRIAGRLLPLEQKRRLGRWLISHMVVRKSRSVLDPELREELRREFAPRVHELETLLGRDLGHWLTPPAEPIP